MESKQIGDLDPVLTDPATIAVRADEMLGRWVNTNGKTRGIAECMIERQGEHISISATGVGAEAPIRWPVTSSRLLANMEEESGQQAVALAATFEFGFMTAETYIRLNKGVLVVVLYVTFLDDSGRSNYVNREFFCRQR